MNNQTETFALLSQDAPAAISRTLAEYGYSVILLPPFDDIDTPVRSHADMLLIVLDRTIFCPGNYFAQKAVAKMLSVVAQATGYTIFPLPPSETFSSVYPNDIHLNALRIGKYLFAHAAALSPTIKEFAFSKSLEIIPVRQGYAHCSSVVLEDILLITADPSIASHAEKTGTDILKISPGHIQLPGYTGQSGFIGGASGVDPMQKIVWFCGDYRTHPDANHIASFCEKSGYQCRSLCDDVLTDIGGILFLPKK